MPWRCALLLASLLAAAGVARAQAGEPFQPLPVSAGTLRLWGPPRMSAVVERWSQGFHRFHPEVAIESDLMGSDTAVPGLYSGQADVALLGREDDVTDDNGFSRPKGYRFERFELMSGSLGTDGETPALAVIVNRNNPVSRITLAQLAAIAGCPCVKGPPPIRRWGALGATGAWADRPVHLYLYDIASGTGRYFVHAVMHDSRKLDWDRVHEFRDLRVAGGSIRRASEQILEALRRDPDGIALSSLPGGGDSSGATRTGDDFKPLAVSASADGPFLYPTRDTVMAHTYPLARRTYALIDRPPGKPIAPRVLEFLRYALSREGQSDVQSAGGYLPLSEPQLQQQLQHLAAH